MLCCGTHAHNLYPYQGYHFKMWKAKQALYDLSNCNIPCRDNNDKYYGIQYELKKDFDPHVDISVTCLQNLNQPKHGLMWVYSHLMVEHLQMDIWYTRCLVTLCLIKVHSKPC